ncbi:ATP-binding protein [Streptomyces klenkii]|uniref:ATP-binding protein n=1 Tax=Streptomyces klenkii TaxID=1420899 RepID=A0A3B0BXJ9_9ACTN|nr:ATP-binding protein [Streptomyces klenkii]RKN76126.1 ATP-binding protein [Streptomyces klenkii]
MSGRQIHVNGQEVVRRWPRHPRCVGLARAVLSRALEVWDLASVEDAALLVLSELLTNAVVHGRVSPGREIETRFQLETGALRIRVDDASEQWPSGRSQRAEGGRGLALVGALSITWGVSNRVGVGKSVWAVLAVPAVKGDHSGTHQCVTAAAR